MAIYYEKTAPRYYRLFAEIPDGRLFCIDGTRNPLKILEWRLRHREIPPVDEDNRVGNKAREKTRKQRVIDRFRQKYSPRAFAQFLTIQSDIRNRGPHS